MISSTPIACALLSVSDKTGIIELAQELIRNNVLIISTGGTAFALRQHNIPVTDVSDYTGFPEMLSGRVKTLHPKIYAGLLRRPTMDDAILAKYEIKSIDLLVVNLYPFQEVVADTSHSLEQAIENIDIGGPTMLRAAAKNYNAVTVLTSPTQYKSFIQELNQDSCITRKTRFQLAQQAFVHVADYDMAIANYLTRYVDEQSIEFFPSTLTSQVHKIQNLRYGENPHQRAAFYIEKNNPSRSVAKAKQHQGKMMSFNNLVDSDCALECVKQFPLKQNTCVIVKHATPCGVAYGKTVQDSYLRAYEADPQSAFGGIIAFNQSLDAETVRLILEKQFVEIIIAPEVQKEALEILKKKPSVRILETGIWLNQLSNTLAFRQIEGGLLVQETDLMIVNTKDLRQASQKAPSEEQFCDLLFAWQVAKFVKSNAIVYVKNGQTLGIGAGQTSRVASAEVGIYKAKQSGFDLSGAVLASDAFFPFRDGIDHASKAGISAIIQPGGSMRDDEVILAADEHEIAMLFTGIRHFRH